jgi:chromosome segregation ATPase
MKGNYYMKTNILKKTMITLCLLGSVAYSSNQNDGFDYPDEPEYSQNLRYSDISAESVMPITVIDNQNYYNEKFTNFQNQIYCLQSLLVERDATIETLSQELSAANQERQNIQGLLATTINSNNNLKFSMRDLKEEIKNLKDRINENESVKINNYEINKNLTIANEEKIAEIKKLSLDLSKAYKIIDKKNKAIEQAVLHNANLINENSRIEKSFKKQNSPRYISPEITANIALHILTTKESKDTDTSNEIS